MTALRLAFASLVVFTLAQPALAEPASITVYKSPTCGCCNEWIAHLETAGLPVASVNQSDMTPVKDRHGVPKKLQACHTASVGPYFVEGHVPAQDVLRLLAERPDIKGLTVPGMPIGSPGMEGPNPERYQVLAVGRDGSVSVYSTHGP